MNSEFQDAVADLRAQGIDIRVHNDANETWYVRGEGPYIGYVVTGAEMVELKRANKLDLKGIKSLG